MLWPLLYADSLAYLPQSGISVEIVAPDSDKPSFSLAAFHPFGPHDGDILFQRVFPFPASSFNADKVRSVDPHGFCDLGAYSFDGPCKTFS